MFARSLFALVSVFAVSALTACSADTGAGDPAADGEDEITARQLPNVGAIQFTTGTTTKTIGSKAKVAKAMKAMKKPTASTHTPLCGFGPATKITFFDEAGKTLATGELFCFRGSVKPVGGKEFSIFTQPGGLDVLNDDLVPADALWGITKVNVKHFGGGGGEKATTKADQIADILKGYDIEQKIDTHASFPRCMPTHSVTFLRANDEVAYSSFVCGTPANPPASLKAQFSIPLSADDSVTGAIQIDPRPVLEVLK